MGILVYSFLGGMKAVTWTQVAQYIVLIIAYMILVFAIGQALQSIEAKLVQLKGDPKEQEAREIWKKELPPSWEEGKKALEEKLASLPTDDPERAKVEKALKDYPKAPQETKEKVGTGQKAGRSHVQTSQILHHYTIQAC